MNTQIVSARYAQAACNTSCMEMAKEIFDVFLRCRELEKKNPILTEFVGSVNAGSVPDDSQSGFSNYGGGMWIDGFQTGWAEYLQRVAVSIQDESKRAVFENAASDIFELETKNRKLRQQLDHAACRDQEMAQRSDWKEAYLAERDLQDECQCCRLGCHMCDRCRPYHYKQSPFSIAA